MVPARGGSRGIPRKNLVEVGGRSLLAWAIDAARSSSRATRVVVTTDDAEIADAARAAGADVPFVRPADLAADDTPDLPVFQHALGWLEREEGYRPDLVVHLRPTSPARRAGLVDAAVAELEAHPEATSLRSVSLSPISPWKVYDLDGAYLRPLLGSLQEERFNQPRQELPPAWLHDGVIDVVRAEVVRSGSMSGPRILAWRSEPWEAVDIDGPEDLERAERA
ncbi:MAG: acylneuraminate cytidylyltransferase family protein, partial [Actinobacteria bacterium]|nr:acylneuraminate cytidylyltransferase family protein [Actinomycetota bacterium]